MLSEINQLPKNKYGMILLTKYPRSHTIETETKQWLSVAMGMETWEMIINRY